MHVLTSTIFQIIVMYTIIPANYDRNVLLFSVSVLQTYLCRLVLWMASGLHHNGRTTGGYENCVVRKGIWRKDQSSREIFT